VSERKRKRSKITQPNDGINKEKLIAFRADREIARLLNRFTNKSEIITEALHKHFRINTYVICTRCKGRGKMKKYRTRR